MSTLDRRLSALEQIAEDMRLRPIRELAAERGIPFERLMLLYEECRARTAHLRAQSYSPDQILAATAQRLGCTVPELRARTDELVERFGLDS